MGTSECMLRVVGSSFFETECGAAFSRVEGVLRTRVFWGENCASFGNEIDDLCFFGLNFLGDFDRPLRKPCS